MPKANELTDKIIGFFKGIGGLPIFGLPPSDTHEPTGIVLAGREAEETIDAWDNRANEIEREAGRIEDIVPQLKERIKEQDAKLKDAMFGLREAKQRYAEVKTPAAKQRWARRLVGTKSIIDYIKKSQALMRVNVERAEAAIDDARITGALLVEQIEDARLYYELNGQLRLIGSALAAAEDVSARTQGIEKDMEISLEGLAEASVKLSGADLIAAADKLIGGAK